MTESGPHYTMNIHLFSFKSCDVASCEFYLIGGGYLRDVGLEHVFYIYMLSNADKRVMFECMHSECRQGTAEDVFICAR